MRHIIVLGMTLFLFGLYLAFFVHSTIWYTFFAIGGFLLFEGLNVPSDFSVLRKKTRFVSVWFAFILIAIATELVCNAWLNLWDYPSFNEMGFLFHALVIGYPFTGFFGLEVFVFLERLFPERRAKWIVLPLSAFLLGYLVEYPNVFANEWKYINWPLGKFLGIPILASLLWTLLLFALLFRKPFVENDSPPLQSPSPSRYEYITLTNSAQSTIPSPLLAHTQKRFVRRVQSHNRR